MIQPFFFWRNIESINGFNDKLVMQWQSFISGLDSMGGTYVIVPSEYLTYAYLDMVSNVYSYDRYEFDVSEYTQ